MIFKTIVVIINIIFLSASLQNEHSGNVTYAQADNWCCKIPPKVETTSHTQQTTIYVLQHGRRRCGYVSCGFLNLSRCTQWCSETWIEAQHTVESYFLNKTLACPDHQLRCCTDHIHIIGHCLSFSEVYNHQQLLFALSELNIVTPGPAIK